MKNPALPFLALTTLLAGALSPNLSAQRRLSEVPAATPLEAQEVLGWARGFSFAASGRRLAVVPEIGGRIMEYSLDGTNVLWVNRELAGQTKPLGDYWLNYGGYKTWVAPQATWKWPPDPILDAGANTLLALPLEGAARATFRLLGTPSPESGVWFIKDVSFRRDGAVQLTQRLRNVSALPIRAALWDVTQVRAPALVAVPMRPDSRFADGYRVWPDRLEAEFRAQITVKEGLLLLEAGDASGKLGVDSDGPWMLWAQGDIAYVKHFPAMAPKADYPDDGCSAAVHYDARSSYLEMEILGPLESVAPGQEIRLAERWTLHRLPAPVGTPEELLSAIKSLQARGQLPLLRRPAP